jgi:hypothetical protein
MLTALSENSVQISELQAFCKAVASGVSTSQTLRRCRSSTEQFRRNLSADSGDARDRYVALYEANGHILFTQPLA